MRYPHTWDWRRHVADVELRRGFHDRLSDLRSRVLGMGERVAANIERATVALLTADTAVATAVAEVDASVDADYAVVEREVFDLVARQSPVGRDLRFCVGSLRIAQEIERCGDLASSTARRAGCLEAGVGDDVRDLVSVIAAASGRIFESAVDAYRVLDPTLAARVVTQDDAVDDLHRQLLAALFNVGSGPVEPYVDLGLVARFYERIADHAVVIAQRVRFVAEGEMDPVDGDERG